MNDRFIQTQKLYQTIDLESFVFILFLSGISFLFYKFFLKKVSSERHVNIKKHLTTLAKHLTLLAFLFLVFSLAFQSAITDENIRRLLPYLGFATYFTGVLCFIKASRLLTLQYLFLGSMQAGVPMLIVNIFTLILSILTAFWTFNNIFGLQLTPLLATSAAFSIILGLALQDTLGNLFAGISLQVDKTFEIGNWLEIMNGNSKIIGQVKELSWRSTVLVGFAEEMITLPNKLVAQSQISNFSPTNSPIVRSQTFKFSFDVNIPKTLQILEMSATQISDICAHPPPSAFVLETNDHGILVKLIYFIENYGRQYSVGDKVVTTALDLLHKNGIQTAKPRIELHQA